MQVERLPDCSHTEFFSSENDEYGDPVRLKAAIKCLPPKQRQAIEMLGLSEMHTRDAVVASGATPVALRVAFHRGIASLRKALGGELVESNDQAIVGAREATRKSPRNRKQPAIAFSLADTLSMQILPGSNVPRPPSVLRADDQEVSMSQAHRDRCLQHVEYH